MDGKFKDYVEIRDFGSARGSEGAAGNLPIVSQKLPFFPISTYFTSETIQRNKVLPPATRTHIKCVTNPHQILYIPKINYYETGKF